MEPDDEIYANGGADVSTNRDRPIIGSEQLDIEAIIIRAMKMEALRMAYEEIKKGENTQLFRDVVQRIDGRLGSDYGMDSAWCEMVDRRADHRKEKLENELKCL
ncbi:26S PROTESOME SUBUNIT 6 [Salix viminalis]|uniref:26S PROTESOME SUBUNIT 6 n=1 Tax=Salix viminalis TaxID=40686 RepID=A0A9Q0SFS0_SALVM|nr:26S PROTESOME SUBUNIT 6 [Salix viminalis]